MSPYEFQEITNATDTETVTQTVFDQAYVKWITFGNDALTVGELTVYCVETTFEEVCNGGIGQYLGNESGQLAKYCPDSLQRLGLTEYARIMQEAIDRCRFIELESEVDDDDPRSPWIEWMPATGNEDDLFDDLEKRFFELYFADKTEFRRKLFRYITDHESEFVTPNS